MLYRWLNYTTEIVARRADQGGNQKTLVISQISGPALQYAMTVTAMELPIVLYAYEMRAAFEAHTPKPDCPKFVKTNIGI